MAYFGPDQDLVFDGKRMWFRSPFDPRSEHPMPWFTPPFVLPIERPPHHEPSLLAPWPAGMAETNRLALIADPESWQSFKKIMRRKRDTNAEAKAIEAAACMF